jgi:LuxR family transcriptional regulator, maltose regulon positive regulatory protein
MSTAAARRDVRALGVIEPKLMPPRVHPGMLRRARLLNALDDASGVPLTVLNAGVGYGKTTLARSWCTERPEPVIWLTLDPADDDPVRLWAHLATGVERLGPGLGSHALSALAAPGASIEAAVDEVMNGLVAYKRRATIVLDDLHAIKSEATLRSIGHAIERIPTNARLVASTRSDPQIGLARLRATRALTEVRASDLAFNVEETSELLSREGVDLSRDSIELLADRTEGWPAGLYLAALWLRDLDDPDAGVREFAGSARHVGDYLTEEVLSGLAPDTRDFLLRTSVLGRFTPALCDSVLGRADSAAILTGLARSNMFLVALDARGEWYRYHHLFGEVLQLELGSEAAVELRRRAAAWCGEHGLVEDAIEYAASALDAETVARLLEDHHLEFIWGGRLGQLLGWMRWLPPEILEEHPLLPGAGALAATLQALPDVEIQRLLAIAEGARRSHPELWTPYLEATVDLTRAAVIQGNDVGGSVEHGRRALAVVRAGDEVLTVGALAALAHALFFFGDLDETRRNALEVVERPDAASRPVGYAASLGLLALVDAERGRFENAEAWARQALSFASERFLADTWVASPAHLGLALAYAGTGRLDDAEREAARGEELRRSPQPTVGHAHSLLVLAEVRVARSRLARATSDLEHARRAISEFADPGRLPGLADAVEEKLVAARLSAGDRNLIEAPSPAELAVLRGLAAGLSRREIGERLYISLNTVKSHTRELYRKLGANSQADAVARAEALGLLDGAQSPG